MELNRRVGRRVYGNHPTLPLSRHKSKRTSLPNTNKGTKYLENTERLPMTDPLGASPVDRENSIPLLDPAVPVRQTSSDHFVHLREDNKEVESFSASPSYYMI